MNAITANTQKYLIDTSPTNHSPTFKKAPSIASDSVKFAAIAQTRFACLLFRTNLPPSLFFDARVGAMKLLHCYILLLLSVYDSITRDANG